MEINISKKRSVIFAVLLVISAQFLIIQRSAAQWSQMNGGNCNITYALCPNAANTAMYAGMLPDPSCTGTIVNTPTSNHLVTFNGTTWSQLNANCNVNGTIYAIATSGTKVFLGGDFTKANGVAGYNGVACWDIGSNTWTAMGTGVGGSSATVYALTVDATNGILYVGGEFTTANGTTVNNVAAWNIGSSAWSAMGGSAGVTGVPAGSSSGAVAGVYGLTYCAGKVYVGGRFSNAGGATANNVAAWDGTTWSTLSGGGQVGVTNVTTQSLQNIASPTWDAAIMAMCNDGTNVYMGGDFDKANNTTGYHNIASWNTSTGTWGATMGGGLRWPALGANINDNTWADNANVYALCWFNGNLYAGGDFEQAGTVHGRYFVAGWNGSSWFSLSAGCGSDINSDIFALAAYNGVLCAGGQFIPGATGTYYVAQYTGAGPTITMNVGSGTTICSGTSTTLSASGASTYTWSANAGGVHTSTVSVSPTSTTVYTVTGTSSGCNSALTVTVNVTATPTLTVNSPTICTGNSATLTAATATSYSWSTSATTSTISVSPTSTTVYTVTGSNGSCSAIKTATVTVNTTPTVSITGTSSLCSGNSVVLTGGTATNYTWLPGGVTTSTISVSPSAGNTTYTLTGANGSCTATTSITLTVTASPTLTVNSPSICSGQSAVLTAGTANSYSWSTSATTNTISVNPTSTTVYTVTGDNGNGCTSTKTATVNVTTTPTVSISGTNTVCSGNPVVLTGGTAATYTWSTSANTSTISVSPASNTTYTLTGANGACTATAAITITVTPTPTLTVNSPSICSGQSVVLTAGTANTYSWSTSATTNTISVNPTSTTVYTVTGDNGNGCTITKTATVNVTATPTLNISGAAPICSGNSLVLTGGTATSYTWLPGGVNTSTISITPPAGTNTYTLQGANGTCTASTVAFVDVSPTPTINITGSTPICSGQSIVLTGGTASTYTWSANAGAGIHTNTVSVSPTTTTTYTLGGTSGLCTSSATVSVTVAPTPTLSIGTTSYTICNGDNTPISASGATSYTWTTGSGLSCTACATPTANPSATTIYTVTGTTGSCNSAPATVTVSVNQLPNIAATPNSANICSSTSTTITASGGSTYTWSPAGSLSSPTGSPVTATPTASTTYTITGTDNNGCQNTNTVSITVAPTPTMNINAVPGAICAGQSVTLNGGTASTYTWSANAGSANTATVSVSPNSTDTYTLTGTIGSCTATAVTTVTVNPLPVIGTASVNAAPCGQSTGCINSVSVSGGTPTYTYSWNGGAGSTSSQFCNQPAGTYVLVVTDANNCQSTQNFSIPSLNGPSAPAAAATSTVACLGDSVSLSVTSPQAGIVYTWTDLSGTHTGTTYTITNIGPGGGYNVTVTATDTNGCLSAGTPITIMVHDIPATQLSGTAHFCKNTSTVLNAAPTGSNYSYQWTQNGTILNGATSSSYTATTAGNYSVIVSDNNTGCKAASTGNYVITIDSLPVIDTANMNITASGCNQSTGSVTNVTVTPNASNNSYSWTDGGGNVVGTGINLNNVPAGTYCLLVTDSNNCKTTVCGVSVNNSGAPNSPILSTPNNTYCSGDTINPISVSGTGTLTWYSDAGLTTQLDTGATYTPGVVTTTTLYVTATNNGCQSLATPVVVTINQTPPSPLTGTSAYVYCQNQTPGAITASGTGTINWSTSPAMSPVINVGNTYTPGTLPIGTTVYYLQDSTAAGCKSTATTTVVVTVNANPSDPVLSANSATYCQGDVVAPLTATGNGTIIWSTSPTMNPVINTGTSYTPVATVGTTVYYVQDTSAAGCKSITTATASITVNPSPNAPGLSTSSYTYCQNQTPGAISATGTGTILWSTSPTMSPVINTGNSYTPTGLPAGTTVYYLTDSTVAGCKSTSPSTVAVTVNPNPTVAGTPVVDSALCGNANGGISGINVTGGTPAYTYQWYNNGVLMPGETNSTLSNVSTGSYSVLITDANGCVAQGGTTAFTVNGSSAVLASITPPVSQGQAPFNVSFGNNTAGATSYTWDFGNGQTSNQQTPSAATYTAPGTYTVTLLANNGGCMDTTMAVVIVDSPVSIVIPNIYSPNGDGINDTWYITTTGIRELHCDIFNRWGQLVYQLQGLNDVWNGTMNNGNQASEGTYFYILDATGYDGKTYKSHGSLTLVK